MIDCVMAKKRQGDRPNLLDPKQRPQKPESETGEQIGVALDGLTEALLGAFAPKKVPANRERPIVPMKPPSTDT